MQENYYNAKFSVDKALIGTPNNPSYLELKKEINGRLKDV
jgi:hypothetical protein